jgi:hypothetical protein
MSRIIGRFRWHDAPLVETQQPTLGDQLRALNATHQAFWQRVGAKEATTTTTDTNKRPIDSLKALAKYLGDFWRKR